jgi:hypothetical protein
MSIAEQMNSLSRLVIVMFIVLLLFKFKYSILFLLLSLLFIIILYYIQKNTMEKIKAEYYTDTQTQTKTKDKHSVNISASRFDAKDSSVSILSPEWMSENQQLVGQANPKTKIAPIITPPLADLDYWRATNLVNHSHINQQSNTDFYRSGYKVSPTYEKNYRNNRKVIDFSMDYGTPSRHNYNNLHMHRISHHYPVTNDYNENVHTQIIQPGIYTRNEVIEPINSNIGISSTQEFHPTTIRSSNRNILYTEHDSHADEHSFYPFDGITPNESNVYDPRFNGYGTSYRSYIDENVGQPRFYYDDIDAIRMPNYITRNHIDIHPFADQYGPIKTHFENGNPFTSQIHEIADDAFLQNSLMHRSDLSQRQMRKINSEMWQRRVAPIRTY